MYIEKERDKAIKNHNLKNPIIFVGKNIKMQDMLEIEDAVSH